MKLFKPSYVAYAHCDLPCGVYDPAQARIEAESVLNAATKYHESDDPSFKQRCEPFRRDAMKKPVRVAGIKKEDMRVQKNLNN